MSLSKMSSLERLPMKKLPSKPQLHTDDLAFWPILQQLEPDFQQTVEHFFLFRGSKLLWTRDGRMFGHGCNIDSELGVGLDHKKHPFVVRPVEVVELRGRRVVQMAFNIHVMALTAEGDLFGWGSNCFGQVGAVSNQIRYHSPVLVKRNVCLVRCGNSYTLALDSQGGVWCWGLGLDGYLGTGDHRNRYTPVKISLPGVVVDLQCNSSGTNLALTADHEVYRWGLLPQKMLLFSASPVVAIAPSFLSSFIFFTANGKAIHYSNIFLFELLELPEPVVAGSIIFGDNRMVSKTHSGGLFLLYFSDLIYMMPSSLTSLADIYVFYGGCYEKSPTTPDLVTVSEVARARVDLHFNNPRHADMYLSDFMFVDPATLAQRQPYFTDPSHLKQLKHKKAPFHHFVIYSYLHYLQRGTPIDQSTLAFPLWTLAYYYQDLQLNLHLTSEIADLLLGHYRNGSLMKCLKQDLWRLRKSLSWNVPRRRLFNSTSRLDASLQVRIIRWIIQRSFQINPERIYFGGFSVNIFFHSADIDSPNISFDEEEYEFEDEDEFEDEGEFEYEFENEDEFECEDESMETSGEEVV